MAYRLGFMMDQIAGHVTNYRNLRRVADTDPEVEATWHEIHYLRPGGLIERARARLPIVPSYYTGILRASLELNGALRRRRRYRAMLSNVSVGVFFARQFRDVPTMIDFDSTPRQIDRMGAYNLDESHATRLDGLKFRLYRDMLHSAARLQAWSHWAKRSAVEEYGVPAERVIVNPPGVDLAHWRPGTAAEAGPRPPRVLFVGGDFRRKGGPLLLDWYAGQAPDACELHIVTREPVEARPGVHVYGDMQPNSERLLRLYQTCDLFVLPSLGECFGIATVEAMAAGLPVIASDVGGTADIIEPGGNGFIVPASDGRALGEAISAVLGDAGRRRAMAARSRRLAEERFDLRRNAGRTIEELKRLADAATLRERQPAGLVEG